MKTIANKSKNEYKYNCDICNKEISFKNNTMFQLIVKSGERTNKKVMDLCTECYKEIIESKLGGKDEVR